MDDYIDMSYITMYKQISKREKTDEKPSKSIIKPSKPKSSAQVKDQVEKTYNNAGWLVYRSPNNCINHFIAHRGQELHFIRVSSKSGGDVFKSTFIQNALSNSAVPVYAGVDDNLHNKINLIDVNINSQIILE